MFRLFTKSFIDAKGNVLEYPMYSNDCGVMESDKTAGKRLWRCV